MCISDDAVFAAEISSLYSKRNYYFPVLEGPRMARQDYRNEVVRRNNTMARIQPDKVIIAALENKATNALKKYIPSRRFIELKSNVEIDSKLERKQKSDKVLHWGHERLSIGLLKAKQTHRRLQVDLKESPRDTYISGEGDHLVVFEERIGIESVIVANYAFSIGSALQVIPPVPEEEVNEIIESCYSVYAEDTDVPITEKIENLRYKMRQMIPKLNIENAKCITFITSGMPWGFAFPEIPSTHINSYPDMGIFLVNAMAAEQKESPGIRVAVIVDPGKDKTIEFDSIVNYLKGSFIRVLSSQGATVHNVSFHLEAFPCDFVAISTHAAEISGRRLTYQFIDKEGISRELVIDQAVGFGIKPGTELVRVQEFIGFVSLDGIGWNDPEKKKKLYVGTAILDFMEMLKNNKNELKLVNAVDVPRVHKAMALKMYDDNFIPIFHSMGDHNSPIIFNNACSSWKEMSGRFIFGGARAYVGTMFDVTGIEAKELAYNLFTKHGSRFLVFALWRAQNDTYDTKRHPYVMIGPHFTRIRPEKKVDIIDFLISRLKAAITSYRSHVNKSEEEDIKRNSNEIAEFLESELNKLVNKFGSNSV